MPCRSVSELVDLYGANWSGVVTINKGPFNSPQDCEQGCGVCCLAGCESDFALVNECTENAGVGQVSDHITDDGTGYLSCNDYYYSPGYPYASSKIKTCGNNASTTYGWCPGNFTGGFFEDQYDCSSLKHDTGSGVVSGDMTYSELENAVINDPWYGSDPCGGNYPCTGYGESVTYSGILVQKNPVFFNNNKPPVVFGGENYPFISLYGWDTNLSNFLTSYAVNGSEDIFYYAGSYLNYFPQNESTYDPVPACDGSGPVIPGLSQYGATHKDIVVVFRFSFSSTCAGTLDYQPESSEGANDGYVYLSQKEWVHSRKHDTHLYVCDSEAGTMTDVSSSGYLDAPMPFYYPWTNDDPIIYSGATNLGYPGWVIGASKGTLGYLSNYNNGTTTNAVVGTIREGTTSTVYGLEDSNGIVESFSGVLPGNNITAVALPEFFPLPDLSSNITASTVFSCSDTTTQSGCLNSFGGGIWHSGATCSSIDCNPCVENTDCQYCETQFSCPRDYGSVIVSGAGSFVYDNPEDEEDPYNGTYDINGVYNFWYQNESVGDLFYYLNYSGVPGAAEQITTFPAFLIDFYTGNILVDYGGSVDAIWSSPTRSGCDESFVYSSYASGSAPYATINNPAPTVTFSIDGTYKSECDAVGGIFYSINYGNPSGTTSVCVVHERRLGTIPCVGSPYISGSYYDYSDPDPGLVPYVLQTQGVCCSGTCYSSLVGYDPENPFCQLQTNDPCPS